MQIQNCFQYYGRFFLVFLLHLRLVLCWRSYDTDLVGYHFEVCDSNAIKQCNITIQQYNQRRVLNGSLVFSKDMADLLFQLNIKVPRPNAAELTIIDTTLNVCEVLQEKNANLIRILLMQFQKTAGYFPDRCPVQGNRPILIDTFYVDPDMFPPYMPELDYTCNFKLLSKGKHIFKATLNGTVRSRRKRKLAKATQANLKYV